MSTKRSLKDNLLRSLLSGLTLQTSSSNDDDDDDDADAKARLDLRAAKDLINALAGWAGKGKDEIIQVLCREIGIAIAAVVKEPLNRVLENRKLRLTLEFVPKSEAGHPKSKSTERKTSSKKRKAHP